MNVPIHADQSVRLLQHNAPGLQEITDSPDCQNRFTRSDIYAESGEYAEYGLPDNSRVQSSDAYLL